MKNIVDIKAQIKSLKKKSIVNNQIETIQDGLVLSNDILSKIPNLLLNPKLSTKKKIKSLILTLRH